MKILDHNVLYYARAGWCMKHASTNLLWYITVQSLQWRGFNPDMEWFRLVIIICIHTDPQTYIYVSNFSLPSQRMRQYDWPKVTQVVSVWKGGLKMFPPLLVQHCTHSTILLVMHMYIHICLRQKKTTLNIYLLRY